MKREAVVFLFVGALTVLLDFVAYLALLNQLGLPVAPSKGLSFAIGALFAYFANRIWTFQRPTVDSRSWLRFLVLYAGTLALNVLTNSTLLWGLLEFPWALEAAFIGATVLSATTNFLGMKFFVFKRKAEG